MERILLDTPYVAALVHPPDFCITRNWGIQTHIHGSPRYERLKAMALEVLLLFERVVVPDIFVGVEEVLEGKKESWTQEVQELKKLATQGYIELLKLGAPPSTGQIAFDEQFALSAKYLLQGDVFRDLREGRRFSDWEYEFLVHLMASDRAKELKEIPKKHLVPIQLDRAN